uniref:Uncharacterized protein n=1 Tax=Nelumbo nucifera TaxID=4432 RepID=A0A822ZSG2_NELNU|nr:TPA_asm: hypothetical protein HUJ06_017377 [Nelumbo nucifera]
MKYCPEKPRPWMRVEFHLKKENRIKISEAMEHRRSPEYYSKRVNSNEDESAMSKVVRRSSMPTYDCTDKRGKNTLGQTMITNAGLGTKQAVMRAPPIEESGDKITNIETCRRITVKIMIWIC